MLIENLSYLVTFIATTGIAVTGTLVSYQLFREQKTAVLQILLYQQIFLFCFFIYGIWGNLGLRQILTDVYMSNELIEKLAFFVPLLGIPFLVVSWFMLLKFAFSINGYNASKKWVYFYFASFIALLSIFAFLFQNNFIPSPAEPDIFLIKIFVVVNLFFHLLFSYPFFWLKKETISGFKKEELPKCILIYLTGVGLYSMMLWFHNIFGFVSIVSSILMLFAASALLPVCLRLMACPSVKNTAESDKGFHLFCTDFEISKREAEIIREICSGKTNKAIAEKLFITLQTVKDHTHRIYIKTRVKSRIQLANLVRERLNGN